MWQIQGPFISYYGPSRQEINGLTNYTINSLSRVINHCQKTFSVFWIIIKIHRKDTTKQSVHWSCVSYVHGPRLELYMLASRHIPTICFSYPPPLWTASGGKKPAQKPRKYWTLFFIVALLRCAATRRRSVDVCSAVRRQTATSERPPSWRWFATDTALLPPGNLTRSYASAKSTARPSACCTLWHFWGENL